MENIHFKKTGLEIKEAIEIRCAELGARLEKRNETLEKILDDRSKVRSYMLRQGQNNYRSEYESPPIVTENDIPSEEIEEISQLCKRINQMEQEINRLKMIQTHIDDHAEFDLPLNELVRYGFKLG